jgi:predicted aspartyl protease
LDKVDFSESTPENSVVNASNYQNLTNNPGQVIMNAEASAQFLAMLTAMQAQTAAIQAQSQINQQALQDQREQQEAALQLQRDQTNAALLQQQQQSQAQLAALAEQLKNLGTAKSNHPKPPAQKLEQFDLDKDGHTFKQWRSRWTTHLEFYGLNEIEDDEEKHKAQYHHLKPALSTKTLAWLDNRNLPDENSQQPDFILNHIDAFLKESVNITMKVVDLVTMTRHPHEPTDNLLARINDNASYVNAEQVAKDPVDFLCLVALQVAVSPELRVRIWQEKAKTYHEAAMICKQDELAHMNAKMNRKDGTINATSHYKQAQTQERQAQQPYQGGTQQRGQYGQNQGWDGYQENHNAGYAHMQQPFLQGYQRFNTTGQTRPYNGPEDQMFEANRSRSVSTSSNSSQPPISDRDRGRSWRQEQHGDRPRSRSKRSYPGLSPDLCYSCGNMADHPRHSCPAYSKTCDSCGKTGHVKKVCQQPQGQEQVSGTITAVFAPSSTATRTKNSSEERNAVLTNRAKQIAVKVSKCHAIHLQSLAKTPIAPIIASIKENLEFAGIEALDTIAMGFRDIDSGHQLILDILPDTGANVTAVSHKHAQHLQIEMTDIELRSADNTQFEVLGKAKCILSIKGREAPEYVYVIANLAKPLVSRRALKALGLLHPNWPHQDPGIYAVSAAQNSLIVTDLSKPPPTLLVDKSPFVTIAPLDNSVVEKTLQANKNIETKLTPARQITTGCGPELDALIGEYPDLFDGKCTPMHSGEYTIELEPGAKPVSSGACRNIQLPYIPALKRELESLVEQDIIEKITHATPWLHPIVVVPKKGTADIRLCIDFTKLNKFVKRPVNPQPTPWEVVRNLPTGARHFAVFDALKGYHQIPLAEESRDLTAFMTPFGRYRYKRLVFGMNSANDVFTLRYGNAVDEATDGLRATEDTLIRGSTTQDLVNNTRKFFDACRLNGITLNLRKIQWDKQEVLFAGFLLNPTGYRLDPSLNKALSEFPVPTNQTDVRSFCGLANQLSNSSQDIATSLVPLSSLLKKGRMFQWLPEHQTAFESARKILSSERTLAYYAPTRQTRLVTDASRLNGLGFVLKQLQDDGCWRPVQAGSRFLSSAETRYAMIELEMLAIAWACAKTANFVEGLPVHLFEIWTDHNPLIAILSSQTLPEISNKRLQRLKMKVDHLTFTIKWIQGKDNVEADVLSRHPCSQPNAEDQLDEGADAIVCVLALDVNLETHTTRVPQVNPPTSRVATSDGVITAVSTYNNANKNSIAFNNAGNICVMTLAGRDVTDERRSELRKFANNDDVYKKIADLISKGFPNLKTS